MHTNATHIDDQKKSEIASSIRFFSWRSIFVKLRGSKSKGPNGVHAAESSHSTAPSPLSTAHPGDGEIVSFFRGATHVNINGSPSFNVRLCTSEYRRLDPGSDVRRSHTPRLKTRSKDSLSTNPAILYKTPRVLSILEGVPEEGPVIMFSIDKRRCDAFALLPHRNAPILVPLAVQKHELEALRLQMHQYLQSTGLRSRTYGNNFSSEDLAQQSAELLALRHCSTRVMTEVLSQLWSKIVKPILDALAYTPTTRNHRRIYWCPSGPLAFVPLHAAGVYGPTVQCISDYAISSYTPSVSRFSCNIGRNPRRSNRLLFVGQSDSTVYGPIPETTKEIDGAAALVQRAGGEITVLEGHDATMEAVKLEMPDYGSIHFACHATQLPGSPLNSGFQLTDGTLRLSDIITLRMPAAELAFLSTCSTSVGDVNRPDETVHLAAGMMSAGYQSVVAAAWAIKDNFCSGVADDFYAQLTDGGQTFDPTKSAVALDFAVRKLRQEVGNTEEGLLTWAPYVHFGV